MTKKSIEAQSRRPFKGDRVKSQEGFVEIFWKIPDAFIMPTNSNIIQRAEHVGPGF